MDQGMKKEKTIKSDTGWGDRGMFIGVRMFRECRGLSETVVRVWP